MGMHRWRVSLMGRVTLLEERWRSRSRWVAQRIAPLSIQPFHDPESLSRRLAASERIKG